MEPLGTSCLILRSFMLKLNFSNYAGREHAYIKHYLLAQYLPKWGFKTGSKWDQLVFIDGFAGPWGSRDDQFNDTSFGIATKAMKDAILGLSNVQREITGLCIFVEKAPASFSKLNEFTKKYSNDLVRSVALKGRFIEKIPEINQYISTHGTNPFKFVFLDQKGWAAAPMAQLRTFIGTRSCELLFNVMTSFLTRFNDRDDLASSYDSFF